MNKKIAIVTGGTSGIGKATALALRGAGYTVYEFSRREAGVEGLHHIRADITDETQVRAAVQQVMDAEGQIDVVVNNAGFGISGAVEFTDTADAQRLFNADFFGMVRVNRAVIAHMRAAEKTVTGDEVYGGRISRSVSRMEHDEQTGMDPAAAGRFIARVAQKTSHKPIYTIRLDYQFFVFLKRILPYRALNALIGLIYAK